MIQHYTNTCLAEREAIVRSSNWWISTVYSKGSLEGFVTYPHCPFDYCKQDSILLNLNHPDDQCALNRSGTLCGGCQHGLSLTLGGSTCSRCSNRYLPVMLLSFIVAGIVLIITLLLLQLNVAIGTNMFWCSMQTLCLYLGVCLTSNLSWSAHTQAVCSKAKQLLGLLYRKFY